MLITEKKYFKLLGKAAVKVPTAIEIKELLDVYKECVKLLDETEQYETEEGIPFDTWRNVNADQWIDVSEVERLLANDELAATHVAKIVSNLEDIIDFLDETEADDRYGTEGWRHCIGWD